MRSPHFLLPGGLGLSGLATVLLFPAIQAPAQTTGTAVGNATVQPGGPRTGGNGLSFFNVEGSGNTTNATFGVLDFAASSFNPGGQTANGVLGNTLTLSLTESNAAFSAPATLEFFLTTNTAASIIAGTSTLKYQSTTTGAYPTNDPPFGIDPLLGSINGNANGSLFDLGTASFQTAGVGNTNSGTVDRYTLTLSGGAISAFLTELNTSGGNLRLLAVSSNAPGAGTFAGATNTTASTRPTLAFTPTFATANGFYRQSTAGSWTPTGGTDWATTAPGPGNAAWTNDGTATAFFTKGPTGAITINAGNINAAGLQFDVDGYTIAGTGAGNTLTLTGSHLLTVTNATDTATISAPIAGNAGLSKLGAGTLALTGANTFSGAVNILAGTLAVGTDGALGNAANAVTLNGGTLRATGNVALNANRTVSGTGGLDVATGNTLTINGVVNATAVTLTNAGTVVLANTTGFATNASSSNTLGALTFNAAGGTLSAPTDGNGVPGVTQIGNVSVAASVTSGTVSVNSNVFFATNSTNTFTVNAAGATLAVNGNINGGGVLVQSGPGTIILNGDNTNLTGTGATPASVRQGGGGTLVIPATNPNPSMALGSAQLQANGGTLLNNTGAPVTLPNSISLGASVATATPNGFVIAGNNAAATVTFSGNVGLFGTVARTLTVNTPTTFTGLLSATAGTTGASLTIAGTSTLTVAGTAGPSTLANNVTIATTGTGGVIAAQVGAFANVPTLTLANTALLTIGSAASPGTGTTDALNDAGLVSLMASGGTFGRLALTLGGARETVGGLQLGMTDTFTRANGSTVTLMAGLAPAGTFGAVGSGADYQSNDYFLAGNNGLLLNSATAVPEPSTWALLLAALSTGGMLAVRARRRHRRGLFAWN